MNKFTHLATISQSDDFSAICGLLAFLEPGDLVPEPEDIAAVLDIDLDVVRFSLDTLLEASAIVPMPPEPGIQQEAA